MKSEKGIAVHDALSVLYSAFGVPTLHINDYRNCDIVLNALIAESIALGVEHCMAGKGLEMQDFYKVSLCSSTMVSLYVSQGREKSWMLSISA